MCECERVSATTASPLVPRACDAGQRRWGGGATRDDGQRQQIFAVLGFFTRSFNPCRCVCVCVCVSAAQAKKFSKEGESRGSARRAGAPCSVATSRFPGESKKLVSLVSLSVRFRPPKIAGEGGEGVLCVCARRGRDGIISLTQIGGFCSWGFVREKKERGRRQKDAEDRKEGRYRKAQGKSTLHLTPPPPQSSTPPRRAPCAPRAPWPWPFAPCATASSSGPSP